MAGLDWPVPDYSTLCRRQARIAVQIPYRRSRAPLNLLIPSRDISSKCPAGQWTAQASVFAVMENGWLASMVRRADASGARSIWRWTRPLATSARLNLPRAGKATARSCRSCCRRFRQAKRWRRSRLMAPMTAAVAMRRFSSVERNRSSRSDAMVAPGNPTAPPRYRETRSCGRGDVWGDRYGRNGLATTPEVASKPSLSGHFCEMPCRPADEPL